MKVCQVGLSIVTYVSDSRWWRKGGGLDVPRPDKSHWMRVRVHAYHNGFLEMQSFTRGREVMGEKAETESSKIKSHISSQPQTQDLFLKETQWRKKKMSGMKEVTSCVYFVSAFCALHKYKRKQCLLENSIAIDSQNSC